MSTLSAAEVNAIFDEHNAKFPLLANTIGELKTLYMQKYWHQMTDVLLNYVKETAFDAQGDGNELIQLYEKMILKMNHRLNPTKYALITIACSRQFESIEDSIKFLDESKERLRNKQDALFLIDVAKADKLLSLGQHHDCFEQLERIQEHVKQVADVDAKVYSSLAAVYGLYYKRKDDHENYYKSQLQYLAYTPKAEISDKEKKELSIKMGMSILLGKKVFNIAELLDMDIINILLGTEFEWLYHMMKTLGLGQIQEFNKTVQSHQEFISKFQNIVGEMTYLEQKVRIIAFLEMIFESGKDERSMKFDRIAEVCSIEQCDVELLIMKAMSLELIKGTIDEVEQVVHVDWIRPRYLNKGHLQIMVAKMNDWQQKLEHTVRLVENNSAELVQS